MTSRVNAIAERRLANQRITGTAHRHPADVVGWCGAVQAQEYAAATWALGLRMHEGAVQSEVERAFDEGRILRTHLMRPTWHFVTPDDIRWLLALTAPRVHRVLAVYHRQMELDTNTFVRGTTVIERALRDRQYLTRPELGEKLRRSKLVLTGIRLAMLTIYAELEGVICSGPRRGRQMTYALLAARAPAGRQLTRDEALAELTRRYLQSHGPATIRDFVWWSGLLTGDARRGIEIVGARRGDADGLTYWSLDATPATPTRAALVHLLPIYDEYLVAHRDRTAVPYASAVVHPVSGTPVQFQHAVVVDGQVVGTWRMAQKPGPVSISATLLRRLTARERRALTDAIGRYERFRGVPVDVQVSEP